MSSFTPRAKAVTLRTYNRPVEGGFESWEETIERSTYQHQLRLWVEAGGDPDGFELMELRELGLQRKSTLAGRTLWLGGTDHAFSRPCCQTNCAFEVVASVYDLVDFAWLLLNGSGVGFIPRAGILHGFKKKIELEVIPSKREASYRGRETNIEIPPTEDNNFTWVIGVGDSAKAWAKALGKLHSHLRYQRIDKLVLDGSECRGPGERSKGYGWICNGFEPFSKAFVGMVGTLNAKAGSLLDEIDILDQCNRVGEMLSSRRSAQITLLDSYNPSWQRFAEAKKDYWLNGNNHRRQSNNSLLFWCRPSRKKIEEILYFADECGGDPGIVNAKAALAKCPWMVGFNPCAELLLTNGGFCTLVNTCLPAFRGNFAELKRAIWIMARANYRQTCVNYDDGVLQPKWHQANQALHLCGVDMTGIQQARWLSDYQILELKRTAWDGATSMARELDQPLPKGVCTVKPSGTCSKMYSTNELGEISEGIHNPLGKYIFNWINFEKNDPLVQRHREAGYRILENPSDPNNALICFPVEFKNIPFQNIDGLEVDYEPATAQLERYLRWTTLWADYNSSATISYLPHEIPEIADWIYHHWNRGYIATSFLPRLDPTIRPEDIGQPYLPQQVVAEEQYYDYTEDLRSVNYDNLGGEIYEIGEEECATGACPVR